MLASASEGVSWREVALRTRCGTPGYAAPEVISAAYAPGLERRYGLECDMWAVGVIVYILVRTRKRPRRLACARVRATPRRARRRLPSPPRVRRRDTNSHPHQPSALPHHRHRTHQHPHATHPPVQLSACPPFSARDDEEMQRQICDSNGPPFPPKYWAHISPPAIYLIRALLTVDPAKRLTAIEALQHPWVVSIQADAEDLLGDESEGAALAAAAAADGAGGGGGSGSGGSAGGSGSGVLSAEAPPLFRDRFGEFNLQRRTTARGLSRVQQLMAVEMGLPDREAVRQLWRCSYEQRLGQLVLSSEHVGFVAYDSTSLWLRPLSELVHLNTARYVASNAATDNSIILSFRDGQTAQLDGFWAREDCLAVFASEEATAHVTTRHEPPPPPPPRSAERAEAEGAGRLALADGVAVGPP